MLAFSIPRLAALPAISILAGLVAACSGTTYGTGVSPEQQTVTDLMGIASLGGNKTPPIDYRPRGNVVAPPNASALPVPGSGATSVAVASVESDPNWPKDPDVDAQQRKAAKQASFGQPSPNFVLPAGQTSIGNAQASANAYDAQRRAEGKKAWDEMHKSKRGSVDANGNPVRKYLTEPPTAYREPDPNSPMSDPPKAKMKKFDITKLWPF